VAAIVSEQWNDLVDDYRSVDAVLSTLQDYLSSGELDLGDDIKTISDLIRYFELSSDDLNSNLNKQKLLEGITLLDTEKSTELEQLYAKQEQIDEIQRELEDRINAFHEQLTELQNQMGVKFNVNNEFALTKISKGANGPKFSVIFSNSDNGVKPYILYRGKEYERKVRQLGAGGFGKVKLG
ncbi:MAG TPA: hypothetical protein PLD88_09705, partial [Candidatus Berkiella sp.]|nr:hypothetical protein [Candidatus Berkiella sp.]